MTNQYYISTQEFEDAKKYWLNKLSGDFEEIKIPYGYVMEQKRASGKEMILTLDEALEDKLTAVSKNQDLLLYVYLLAAFKILLMKLSGVRDISVSSPVFTGSNETQEQYNQFIFLRDFIEENETFKELLMGVKQTVIDGYKNQHYPMDRIYELIGFGKNTERNHNVCFYFKNIHGNKCLDDMTEKDNYHFVLSLEKKERLEGKIIIGNQVMDEAYAEKILAAYKNVLSQVAADMNLKISDIWLADVNEVEMLDQFNTTALDFGEEKTITELFEEQARKSGDTVAVIFVSDRDKKIERLTYKELNKRANRLAESLKKNGVAKGDIVSIMVHSSLDTAVGILGILKAGGAYMPIEPDYPPDRIRYMVHDSGTKILVTNCGPEAALPFEGGIIHIPGQELREEDVPDPDAGSSADDPVYMIYTSGTSGKPKGIVVTHKNLFNYVKWRIDALGHGSQDVSLQLLTAAFDGFGTNFYPALLSGGCVVMVDNVYWRDVKYISEVISDQMVTNFSVVPPIYGMILENANAADLKSLRFVVLAGEKSDASLVEISRQKCPWVLLVNEYGPTETTIAVTSLRGMEAGNISIIGKPIANNKIYILDSDNHLMPVGLFGELCVSGKGVSKGYWNRAELTAEKFVKNPFSQNEILYKTGDLARWRQDGTIEYFGRADNQVKIRGYRIELNEIESVLSNHHAIKKAIVTTGTNKAGYTELCAFFIAAYNISIEQLKMDLAGELPEYMIPSQIIRLDEFPLTLNGKIDLKALLLHNQNLITNEYIAPGNNIESSLSKIWEQVLQREKIGINDNFFDLGGNSILIMQAHGLIEKVYPGAATIPDLFSYPSISKLAKFIGNRTDKKPKELKPDSIKLPDEYFYKNRGRRSVGSFKFDLPADLLERMNEITLSEDVRVPDVLLSAFAYLIAKVTGKENVCIQAMMNEKNRISSIYLETRNLSDFTELFNKVKQQSHESPNYVYSEADRYKVNSSKEEGTVLPLFLVRSLYDGRSELLRFFDIVLEVTISGEGIFLACEYDSAYLREEKIRDMLQMYMKTIELMLRKI